MQEASWPRCDGRRTGQKGAERHHWQMDQRPVRSEMREWEPGQQVRFLVEGDVVQGAFHGLQRESIRNLEQGGCGGEGRRLHPASRVSD